MNVMNKLYKFVTILFAGMILFSCDTDELKDLNINPKAANEIDMAYLFTYTQLQTCGERYENWRTVLIYSSTMIQHFATLPTYWCGDKYLYSASYSAALWERAYRNYVKELVWLINELGEDPEDVNKLSAVRIWKAIAFHRITDLHGDIPYSEAGLGYLENTFLPKYDAQSDIYADMLNELEQAAAAFDAGKETFGDQDLLYGGDIDQWKKLAYSMMLRLGMRLSKVDPAAAQSWVGKAIAGGVFESNADNAYVSHTDGPDGINMNGIGQVFLVDDSPRMSTTFINWMLAHNDPRIDVIALPPALGGPHKGMPNGYDATTIKDYEGTGGDDVDRDIYSSYNPLMVQTSSPMFFQTYAEVEFMLAEVSQVLGDDGNAAIHYNAGVTAAMQYLTTFDESLVIDQTAIDDYLTANPYDPANGLEMIGEQYWAATFYNEYESWANWRRTGYPVLTPPNYPGNITNGTIPRRLRYPTGEASVNKANYEAALSAQGPDEFTSRMWWDAQ